ncbi:MAG: CHC2 zinc finger domain-containing protein [Bacteroidota bacterium]
MSKPRRFTDAQLDETRRANPILEVAGKYTKLTARSKRFHEGLCPFHNEKTGSFQVYPDEGRFVCRGCGQKGDVIKFWMEKNNLSFVDAVKELREGKGLADDPEAADEAHQRAVDAEKARAVSAERRRRFSLDKAVDLWRQRLPGAGSPVETAYWPSRGLWVPVPWNIGYLTEVEYWWTHPVTEVSRVLAVTPAMVTRIDHPVTARFMGVVVTHLRPDCAGKAELFDPLTGESLKAKKVWGTAWGGAERFMAPGEWLGVGEGRESVLSVHQGAHRLPEGHPWHRIPVWAAGSFDNLVGGWKGRGPRHPRFPDKWLPGTEPDMDRPGIVIPPGVKGIVQIEDNDMADPEAAEAKYAMGAARWRAMGMQCVRLPAPPGCDFNDLLQGKK